MSHAHFGTAEGVALTLGGSICAAGAAMMMASLACAARVAGWRWTISKLPATLNLVALVLAGILLLIAAASDMKASTDNTRFAIAAGSFGVVSSVFGFFALALRWPRALRAHAISTIVLAVIGVTVAAACIAAGNVRAAESLCGDMDMDEDNAPPSGNSTLPPPPPMVHPECEVAGRLSGDRLLLIGSYAVVASLTSFFEAALLWREICYPAEKKGEVPKTSAVELVYHEFIGGTRDADGTGVVSHVVSVRRTTYPQKYEGRCGVVGEHPPRQSNSAGPVSLPHFRTFKTSCVVLPHPQAVDPSGVDALQRHNAHLLHCARIHRLQIRLAPHQYHAQQVALVLAAVGAYRDEHRLRVQCPWRGTQPLEPRDTVQLDPCVHHLARLAASTVIEVPVPNPFNVGVNDRKLP